ncbi:hypothetical protein FACS1894142_1210 [Spirochaetia bacterium]|nr:hypothetical protein FACS1894142_1210 [Spirochaetia bacterium]
MISNKYILNYKFTDVINAFAEQYAIDLRKALDLFYNSELYEEIREGISDMHCRSDGYLAEELKREIDNRHIGESNEV